MMSRLLPVIALIIAAVIFFAYIQPRFAGPIEELQAQIAGYDAALAAAEEFTEREAELINERNAIAPEELERLSKFLPDGVDNVQLILDLDALAARSGMTLSGFDVASMPGAEGESSNTGPLIEENGPVESIDVTVEAAGSYGALQTFLAGVENSLRLVDVVEVGIETSATGIYKYELTFRVYWMR